MGKRNLGTLGDIPWAGSVLGCTWFVRKLPAKPELHLAAMGGEREPRESLLFLARLPCKRGSNLKLC